MKIEALFNLIADARDILTYFEGVNNVDQLISRLERIKRGNRDEKDELLINIESLRASVTDLLNQTLEMNTQPNFEEESEDDDDELGLGDLPDNLEEISDGPETPDSPDKTE